MTLICPNSPHPPTGARILAPRDLDAVNTADDPDAVAPVPHEVALADGVLTTTLPPASWLAVELG